MKQAKMKKTQQYLLLLVICIVTLFSSQAFGQTSLTHGHEVLLKFGLQINAFAVPFHFPNYHFDLDIWKQSNFTTIDLVRARYHYYPEYEGFPVGPDSLPWAAWGYPEQPTNPKPFADKLVKFQLHDEQEIGASALPQIAADVATLKEMFPGTIIYTNQGIGSSGFGVSTFSINTLRNYTTTVKPDMLHFSSYPYRWKGTGYVHDYKGGSPRSMYIHMEMYRKVGLEGLDGTGAKPIPVGMYVETYQDSRYYLAHKLPTESEFRLQQFAGWAFGMKSVDAFVYNKAGDSATAAKNLFFYGTSQTPTPTFYQYAELNRQSLNIGDTLVRLISTDVRMKMGRRKGGAFNPHPTGVGVWDTSADTYLKRISATNLGTKNSGMEGDTIVGFFKPLDPSFAESGAENDVYFMIVNGLTDETGDAADCRQKIHLEFDFADSGIIGLLRKSRLSGDVERVALTHLAGTVLPLYYLDLVLDGGTGDLFKYDNGYDFIVGPQGSDVSLEFVPEPASLTLLAVGAVALLRKKRL